MGGGERDSCGNRNNPHTKEKGGRKGGRGWRSYKTPIKISKNTKYNKNTLKKDINGEVAPFDRSKTPI